MRGTTFLREKETRSFSCKKKNWWRKSSTRVQKKKFLRWTLKRKKLNMKQQNLPKMQYYWPSKDFWWVPLQLSSVNDHSFLTQFLQYSCLLYSTWTPSVALIKTAITILRNNFFLSFSATHKKFFLLNFQAFFYYFFSHFMKKRKLLFFFYFPKKIHTKKLIRCDDSYHTLYDVRNVFINILTFSR